ncbi:GNAT family N-acetyltransferase [Kitasatospora sp. GAS1066B]|uniref:GNAT family N-acetyltransferase n=1 Tax=Kitasatospora sp. GAS1066B TaxID=3156271 RepID=UPI00351434BC
MSLSTPRLDLRRFRPEDSAALAAYRSDPAVARYQGWSAPVSPAQAAELVRDFAAGDPRRPGWFQYAIELRTDGRLIGDLGVHLHENLRQAELGFTLAPEHQGHGYATEAVRAVLRELFERRGLHRVSAVCDARNRSSAGLLERVGFQLEGRRPEYTWCKGEWTDDLLFGLLADHWARACAAQPAAGRAAAVPEVNRQSPATS